MKNQDGFAFIPVLAGIALAGAFFSGLVTSDSAGLHLHKEVLKQGQAIYKTND